ncbi:hypothetical protein GN244_ATG12218 [Phytophthora infestans]|uniref:Uncharacterized protein n=1 Tax=Phytophthora infestans TaxID=4787 RepID=A0A833T2A6_PHYIN|nr:hypothetical protein GN244_ATG12218 [Phytophthora infestans]
MPTITRSQGPVLPGTLSLWALQNPRAFHRHVIAALLGFFFLLRIAEYQKVKGTRRVYALQVGDVKICDKHKKITSTAHLVTSLKICYRGSKNH